MTVTPSEKVTTVTAQIQGKTDVPRRHQRLVAQAGFELENKDNLSNYDVKDGDELSCLVQGSGGVSAAKRSRVIAFDDRRKDDVVNFDSLPTDVEHVRKVLTK